MKMYGVQPGGGSKSGVVCVHNIWMACQLVVSSNDRSGVQINGINPLS